MKDIEAWAKRANDILDNATPESMIKWLEMHKQIEAENRLRNLEEKVRKLKKYYKDLKKQLKYERR